MEDWYFVSLTCKDCDNADCSYCPPGTYVPHGNKRGCVRKLHEDEYINYVHQIEEVWSLRDIYNKKESAKYYKEVLNTLYKVYNSPLANLLDKRGKIKNK